jgi:4-methyl-5(b-hydroxyethyl)-thiazole monophosphate biosynthesis
VTASGPTDPRALVLLADGSEEIEAVTVIDILRRAEVAVTVAGVSQRSVTASRGVHLTADVVFTDVADTAFDLVVLPGGARGAEAFRDSPAVQALVKRQHQRGGRLAAICAAPSALASAGLLQGVRATSYPGFLAESDGAQLSEEPVVTDGLITTSRGPGTAMDFALALVALLCGEARARDVAGKALAGYP